MNRRVLNRLQNVVRGFSILLLLNVFSCTLFAQYIQRGEIDSLNRIAPYKPREALKLADSLLALPAISENFRSMALLLQVKGIAYTAMGRNAEALENHMRSYEICDSTQYTQGKIYALINLATVHLNLETFRKSKEYLNLALKLTEPTDSNNLKTIYVNLGVYHDYALNGDSALYYYQKAIPFLHAAKDYNGLAVNYHNMAVIYGQKQDYNNSEKLELQALEYQKKTSNSATLAMITITLGSLYVDMGKFDEAQRFIELGGVAAAESKSPYYKESYLMAMAAFGEATGNFKMANDYQKQLILIMHEQCEKERISTEMELEERFQNDLKSKQIELLETRSDLNEATLARSNMWKLILLIIVIFILLFTGVLLRNYRLKKRANQLLSREKESLELQNQKLENENIMAQFDVLRNQISPHFLFNSLNALISLIKNDQERALEFTKAFSTIFRNALLIKDKPLIKLEEEIQHVNAYLYLQQMRFGESLQFTMNIPAEMMSRYIPPFSLQLVVENAIKHNVATSDRPLKIKVTAADSGLQVVNNLQVRSSVEESTKTGLRNVRSRYKYFTSEEPVFETVNQEFYARLPLIEGEE